MKTNANHILKQQLCPKGEGVEIIRFHPKNGGALTIANDVNEYSFQPGQRFVPHVIEDNTHPAKIGDMVGLSGWLATYLGITSAFVSGLRTIKSDKKSNGTRQVELLGLPCRWFSISYFDEYRGLQIFNHIWGNFANREVVDGKVVDIVPMDGKVRRIVLPNL